MDINIALTFSALIIAEITIGYSITRLYDCNLEFDYKCYHTLTLYQFGVIVIDFILFCFCVYQTIINEILNNSEILSLVHEYIHERCKKDKKTENNLKEHSEKHQDKPSNLTKKNIDVDKSINDFNEMVKNLVVDNRPDTQSDEHPENEFK